MARFVLQRLLSALLLLFAISILTFLIFQAIPGGDPAQRLAGRQSTPQTVEDIRKQWGFDKPIYVQYYRTMEKILSGDVISYNQQLPVWGQIKQDAPATLSLAIGAGIIWLELGDPVRGHRRPVGRTMVRPDADGPVVDRRLDAGLPDRRAASSMSSRTSSGGSRSAAT